MYKDILHNPFKFLSKKKEASGVKETITTPVLFATEQGIYVRYLDKKPTDNQWDASSHDFEMKSTNATYRFEFCDYIELPSENDTKEVESDEEKLSDSVSQYQAKSEQIMAQNNNSSAHSSKQVFTLSSRDIHEFGVSEERLDIRDFLKTNGTSSNVTFKKLIRE